MSLISALNIGTSGMESESTDLSVIGDNISNANTIGFKASRTDFEEQLMQNLVGGFGINGEGMGVNVQAIQKMLTQGTLTSTGNATDLAIQGNGMFVVKGSHDGMDAQYYTRDGQFTVDKSGYLVNQEGLRVQGYGTDATGAPITSLGDLDIGSQSELATATTTVTMKGNLNANDAVNTNPFDPNDPTSYDSKSDVSIYDSKGNQYTATVYWVQTAPGQWTYHAMTDGANSSGGTAGTPVEIGTGDLTFGTKGELATQTANTTAFTPADGSASMTLQFNFGTPTSAPGGTGTDGLTSLGTKDGITFTNADGNAAGTLASIQINAQGDVVAAFSNGDTKTIAAVALANFSATDQLQRAGGNLYQSTTASGQATIGTASTGGRGSIVAGALEQSNVDLANEFVKMIAAQRGFEADSKTITTADQLLTELVQLKR